MRTGRIRLPLSRHLAIGFKTHVIPSGFLWRLLLLCLPLVFQLYITVAARIRQRRGRLEIICHADLVSNAWLVSHWSDTSLMVLFFGMYIKKERSCVFLASKSAVSMWQCWLSTVKSLAAFERICTLCGDIQRWSKGRFCPYHGFSRISIRCSGREAPQVASRFCRTIRKLPSNSSDACFKSVFLKNQADCMDLIIYQILMPTVKCQQRMSPTFPFLFPYILLFCRSCPFLNDYSLAK